jgi:RNA polymerase sigma factor (sigma-70 family)
VYALRRTQSPEDAADVVAETFAIAWQRLDDVPCGPEARLWLYASARNVISNLHRASRRRWRLAERLGSELAGAETGQAPVDEDALEARSLLHSLDEAHREVLMLAAWEGLDSAEIGRVLGCSALAARIRLHRARARLTGGHTMWRHTKRSSAIGHVPQTGVALTPQTNHPD